MPLMVRAVAPPPVGNGEYSKMRCDANGNLLVNASSPVPGSSTPFNSAGDVASLVISAAPADLLQLIALNVAGGTRYALLFDAVALPPNGTIPDWVGLPLGRDQFVAFTFGDGLAFSTGIVVALSTTRTILTLAGPDMWTSGRVE
jgi:hypothetical protein